MKIFTLSVEKMWKTMVREVEIGQKDWEFRKLHKISSTDVNIYISITYEYTENKRLAVGKA
jgi:hypothetical protein